MKNKKLGVAVSGTGWVASAHAGCWIKNPQADIVAVFDPQKGKAQQWRILQALATVRAGGNWPLWLSLLAVLLLVGGAAGVLRWRARKG